MVATANDTTVRRIRFDDLTADEQAIAWDLFQTAGLSLPEAVAEARGAAEGLAAYATAWDAEADAALLAAYWPAIDSAEELTPEPEPEPPTPAAPALQRAVDKAEYRLATGIRLVRSRGAVLVPSSTTAGVVYRVEDGRCNCPAGERGRPCWHLAAAGQIEAREVAA